jgi:triacylglycerol lipase
MTRFALALAMLLALGIEAPAPALAEDAVATAEAPREAVVLLHGLLRGPRSMRRLATKLEESGFEIVNVGYDSTEKTFDEILDEVRDALGAADVDDAPRLHFVTFSLGGIVLRGLLAADPPDNLGRIVMLAPPNHGSEIVDALGDTFLFRAVFGPTAVALGTSAASLPNTLPVPAAEFGVIAGTRSWNPIGSLLIPGDDDGTVSIESTKLAGMVDHTVVPRTHTFVINDRRVAAAVVRFLRSGRFADPAT